MFLPECVQSYSYNTEKVNATLVFNTQRPDEECLRIRLNSVMGTLLSIAY